jgi:hypothetical protein
LNPPLLLPLTDRIQPAVLDYLRGSVYHNALLIANVTQLRSRCDVIAALDDSRVVGVASTYDDHLASCPIGGACAVPIKNDQQSGSIVR